MSLQSKKEQVQVLRERGFVVVPGLVSPERCEAIKRVAEEQLHAAAAPLEFEADLRYPGAPESKSAPGGHTVRRLLDAYSRHALYREWATSPEIAGWMELYFGEEPILSRAHHNCMMTKHPHYGSLTGWHRDVRYWSFERDDLVSVWLALGPETVENGGLWLVPGSHEILPRGPARQPRVDRPRRFANAGRRRRGVLPLQHAAFGGAEPERSGEVFAGLHLSRREQRAAAGHALGVGT